MNMITEFSVIKTVLKNWFLELHRMPSQNLLAIFKEFFSRVIELYGKHILITYFLMKYWRLCHTVPPCNKKLDYA